MAYSNGRIPDTALVAITGRSGARLLSGAAAAWEGLRSAVHRAHGWYPTPTGSTDAYRPHSVQESIFRARYTTTPLSGRPIKIWNGTRWYQRPGTAQAAVPGTSNHGLGLAVDITGLGGFTGTRYKQLAAIAVGLGWSNVEGRAIGEAWHWVYTGPAEIVTNPIGGGGQLPGVDVTPPTPIEEDDMPLNDTDKRWIQGAINEALTNYRPTQRADMLEQAGKANAAVLTAVAGVAESVWAHLIEMGDGTSHSARQVLRDTRVIARRFETRWRKFVGLPADPNEGA